MLLFLHNLASPFPGFYFYFLFFHWFLLNPAECFTLYNSDLCKGESRLFFYKPLKIPAKRYWRFAFACVSNVADSGSKGLQFKSPAVELDFSQSKKALQIKEAD